MLFSVRMRAAKGAAHEQGGRHISGAERLVTAERVAAMANEMAARALSHTRGRADFINITIEAVDTAAVRQAELLPVANCEVSGTAACRQAAVNKLIEAGVAAAAAQAGMQALLSLDDSMRGAMLLCASTGRRLDASGERGVRVSRMDIADEAAFAAFLAGQGLAGDHVREALVLASKVASAPDVVAELCWSDDPEYTAGYVASSGGYFRFPQLKEYGSPIGGRVFFVRSDCNVQAVIDYLERQPVLVKVGKGG